MITGANLTAISAYFLSPVAFHIAMEERIACDGNSSSTLLESKVPRHISFDGLTDGMPSAANFQSAAAILRALAAKTGSVFLNTCVADCFNGGRLKICHGAVLRCGDNVVIIPNNVVSPAAIYRTDIPVTIAKPCF